jgi:hypothetical protein
MVDPGRYVVVAAETITRHCDCGRIGRREPGRFVVPAAQPPPSRSRSCRKYYAKQLGRYETRPEHAYVAWELARGWR